jgi:hypothetical protein
VVTWIKTITVIPYPAVSETSIETNQKPTEISRSIEDATPSSRRGDQNAEPETVTVPKIMADTIYHFSIIQYKDGRFIQSPWWNRLRCTELCSQR